MPYTSIRINPARLDWERNIRGWSKGELARRAGINAGGLSRILRTGSCHPRTLTKLAAALEQQEPVLGMAELLADSSGFLTAEESEYERADNGRGDDEAS
jgi:transcriptional regulator with XRE-family HTH domain